MTGKKLSSNGLLKWTLFIGQFVHPVGGEEGRLIVIARSFS